MFVDDVSGIALWPGEGWPEGLEEEDLPITDELRDRIRSWVEEYTESIGASPPRALDLVDHDLRGHQLSRELQEELGAGYVVEFKCTTARGSRILRRRERH